MCRLMKRERKGLTNGKLSNLEKKKAVKKHFHTEVLWESCSSRSLETVSDN